MSNIPKRPWIVFFFSQTGSEIVEVSKLLGRWPDMIVTNERPEHLRKIHPALENKHLIFLDNKPSEEEIGLALGSYINPVVTLHGWLRIMPPDICNRFEIYNGHPGLITEYPELKGKDPQQKAFDLGLESSGCVIHRVTEGVDEGEILRSRKVSITGLEIGELFHILHSISVSLWVDFLKN
jgi:folate-dependent phosphoribosylglycinamide formyltransferase PurN